MALQLHALPAKHIWHSSAVCEIVVQFRKKLAFGVPLLLFLHCLYGLLSLQHFHHIIQFWVSYLKRHLFNFTNDILFDLQNNVFKIWGTCSGVKVTPWTEPAGKVALNGSWSIFSCTSEIFPSMNASKTKDPGGVSKTEGMHAALNTESQ